MPHRATAWAVHFYTALGLPLALLATVFLIQGQVREFFVTLCVAVFLDATDGTMARTVRVREVLPDFDGRRLDDIVDFITFAFLPCLAIPLLGLFPEGWEAAACVPVLASGYGFCQERAKTEESFVGFPSYWNIGVLYLVLWETGPWVNLAIILGFSALVFIPIHYVYPTKTKLLRPVTVVGGFVWAGVMTWLSFHVGEAWATQVAWWTALYPAYYFVLSGVHHVRTIRAAGP